MVQAGGKTKPLRARPALLIGLALVVAIATVAYQDAMQKRLWPDRRLGVESIYRTTRESWIRIPKASVPPGLAPLVSDLIDESGSIVIGPIPQGTPINLLFNIDIDVDLRDIPRLKQLIALFVKIKKALVEVKAQNLAGDAAVERLKALVPDLLAASKCPDFVTDRGHTFGTDLPDADKSALIELVKVF